MVDGQTEDLCENTKGTSGWRRLHGHLRGRERRVGNRQDAVRQIGTITRAPLRVIVVDAIPRYGEANV